MLCRADQAEPLLLNPSQKNRVQTQTHQSFGQNTVGRGDEDVVTVTAGQVIYHRIYRDKKGGRS